MHTPHGIALCCTTHSLGGIELNMLRLAVWMKTRGHRCVLVIVEDSPLHRQAAIQGIECFSLPEHSRYNVLGVARRLARRLSDARIDTLVLNVNRDLLLGVLTKRSAAPGLRLVHTQHMQFGLAKLDAIHRWQHRQLDAWISPLPSLAAQTRRMTAVPPERIHVIPLGIDLAPLLDAPSRADARRMLDLPSEAFIVGVVGRLDKGKGQEYLLHAAARLRAEGRVIHLLIVGEETRGEDQGYANELQRLVERLHLNGSVHFRGFVEHVPTAYAAVDVFTLTSLSETYGMVTIEAMAAGCPVIATNSGGTPELVGSGANAVLVPPADPDALADALTMLMTDGAAAERLRTNGREHAVTHFSHEVQCDAIESLLDALQEINVRHPSSR